MQVDAVASVLASKTSVPQSQGNLPIQAQDASGASKSGSLVHSMDGCGNALSTKDIMSLVMMSQMVDKINEMTGEILKKMVSQ